MDEYRNILQQVNGLCYFQKIPMSTSLVDEVKNVYKNGLSLEIDRKMTPLMLASDWGYASLVWGFIQCAKQTDTNLQTGGSLDLQEFLGYRNSSGQTALHVAAKKDAYYVIRFLLKEVSVEHLISYRDESGNTPISLLERSDRGYDVEIFEVMEAAAASKGDHQVDPTTTHDKQQGFVPVYTETIEMDPNSRPTSHINETRESLDKLDAGVLELTVERKSTILHLVSGYGDTAYAKDILKRHPSLIHNRNIDGETPFYVAASAGHIDILEILISYAKSDKIEELATRSTDKDTALHIAIQKHHVGVVFWLVKRIPQLANRVNHFNESPLYLAVNKVFQAIVELIVKECKEKAYDGPDGKTALHAAVLIKGDYTIRYNGGKREILVGCLLQAKIGSLQIRDMYGWTPLHYAANFGCSDIIRYLLETYYYIGNQMTTPYDIIISAFGITDTIGRNMLHVAIEYKQLEIIKLIFRDESLIISLINQKDNNGNTPLHLLMASSELPMWGIMMDARFPFQVQNNERCTPLDCASSDEKKETLEEAVKLVGKRGAARRRLWEDLEEEAKEIIEKGEKEKKKRVFGKIGDNVVLVVTLIATATFAAAFTVPGGFDGNEGPDRGMPILLRKTAYKAFVVANALAFSCSCTVLFGHIRLQLDEAGEEEKDGSMSINIVSLQYLLTGIAMVAMAIAFVTGTYVILAPSLGFAVPVCAMCLCIMVPLSIFPRKRLGFATAILRKLA